MSQDLVRKDSIEELCGHRARAIALYQQARATMLEARAAHARAVVGDGRPSDILRGAFNDFGLQDEDRYSREVRRLVDVDMWRAFVVNTPLGSLMDRQERKKFEDSLKDEVPDATPENVEATMRRLAGEAGMIFRRGLVNAFQRLDRDYRSHDGFRIGERIVLRCVVVYERDCNWLRTGYHAEDELRDVDRVMHVLDGKEAPAYQAGITAALRAAVHAWRDGGPMECETEYWRLRFFKNGNGHLYARRADLLEKANRLIAEHFGATVGAAPHVAEQTVRTPRRRAHFDEGWFPTPDALAARMVDLAAVEPHHSVLEPSAGTGSLAAPLAALVGANLTCHELSEPRAAELRQRLAPLGAKIRSGDFLESDETARFDRIVMNPPFGQQQDIVHVLETWKRLAPGGRLVAVMSPAVSFRDTPLAAKLRRIVTLHGIVERLPAGTFRAAGTSVETILVRLDRPAA